MQLVHRILKALAAAAVLAALVGRAVPTEAATINVPADHATIQAAINAASLGDVVIVAAGTYTENLALSTGITLRGAQAGVNACGRVASETVVTAANPAVEALQIIGPGATNAIIDGFTFRGTTTAFACVQSVGAAMTGMQFLNNRVREFVPVGVYLNKGNVNGVFSGNEIDGSSQVGAGALVGLDGPDPFHGLQFTNNCLQSTANTGLFVDGVHNWTAGSGATLPPSITGNLFKNCGTGANLGGRSFNTTALPTATISSNTFQNNTFDGLQGGPQNTSITNNTFVGNNRSGLALTSFGNLGVDRGAQNCTITGNTFTANGREGVFCSASQAPGTMATNAINNNNFLGNGTTGTFDGLFYSGTEAVNASCNWWNSIGGPDYLPVNPNPPGDDIGGTATTVVFQPWLDAPAPGGLCNQVVADKITPGPVPSCISVANTCITVPMNITRVSSTNARGYSVTFSLSSNLALCVDAATSITQGNYLSSISGTQFQVVDNGGGSYTVDCAILGLPCGATAATGNLFNVAVKKNGPDGTGTITVDSVLLRDCLNAPIPAAPGPPASVTIDTAGPIAVANLVAAQKKTGNGMTGRTGIQLTFTAPGDASVIEVYRKGFGFYPEYDDAGGAVPATPGAYPPAGWTLTGVTASGQYDSLAATRDFWYYVMYTKDACGNVSLVSNRTGGTLNYHLGDTHDGSTDCAGDNRVNTADISFLGAHYGITLVLNDVYNCLDVGPTTDFSVNARPTTDNKVQFEDLIMFAINYYPVASKPRGRGSDAAAADALQLVVPEAPAEGDFEVSVRLTGAGTIQGVSLNLEYDRAVVTPVGLVAGELMERQGVEAAVLSSAPGNVDLAVMGTGSTIRGEGEAARVTFHRTASGDAGIRVGRVDARDITNRPVQLPVAAVGAGVKPVVGTFLGANYPNPFSGSTLIPLGLKASGPARLAIFDLSGRLVRTLVDGALDAGEHVIEWNGTDRAGHDVASGLYFIRLETGGTVRTRSVRVVR